MLQTLAPDTHRKLRTSVVAEGKRVQAAALVKTTRPDLLISGDAFGKDSLPVVETVTLLPGAPAVLLLPGAPAVLVIAEHITERDARALLVRRAAGVLLSRSAPQHLAWALGAVTEGSRALSPEIADAILHSRPAPVRPYHGAQEDVASLSTREREVLALLSDGLPNRAIAEALHISPETVKDHVRALCVKLHADNRIHAARIAWQAGVAALPV